MTRHRAGLLAVAGLLVLASSMSTPAAEDDEAVRPRINLFYRWLEDWSALADPRLRTEPLDSLKYIPLLFDDPKSYVSLGLTVRERFEVNDAPLFGIGGNKSDSYLLDRLQWHVDVRPNEHWQIFVELEDVRAPAKDVITPVDENPLAPRGWTGSKANGASSDSGACRFNIATSISSTTSPASTSSTEA